MQDRVPRYPGRVKLVPVAGQENVFDLVRADQPTQEGTALNKANLLSDATAALYGLGTDAVPDDALAFLGKYNQHWWRRTSYDCAVKTGLYETYSYSKNVSGKDSSECLNFAVTYSSNGNDTFGVSYSDTVEVDRYGIVHLVNPKKTAEVDGISAVTTLAATLRGKYYQCVGAVRKASAVTNLEYGLTKDRYYTFFCTSSAEITGKVTKTEEYVRASSRNAYPDSGTSGEWEYEYLGIPFDNAVTAPKIVVTGSYVGTGTYGVYNPNSLMFDFEPKMLFIFSKYPNASNSNIMKFGREEKHWFHDSGVFFPASSTVTDNAIVTASGKTFSWYSNRNELAQMNSSNYVYYYVAIG